MEREEREIYIFGEGFRAVDESLHFSHTGSVKFAVSARREKLLTSDNWTGRAERIYEFDSVDTPPPR